MTDAELAAFITERRTLWESLPDREYRHMGREQRTQVEASVARHRSLRDQIVAGLLARRGRFDHPDGTTYVLDLDGRSFAVYHPGLNTNCSTSISATAFRRLAAHNERVFHLAS
jgi:hypothetical protein